MKSLPIGLLDLPGNMPNYAALRHKRSREVHLLSAQRPCIGSFQDRMLYDTSCLSHQSVVKF